MTNSSLRFFLPAVLLLAGLGGITRLTAQGTTATILGTITDASGAVVGGANVQVKNVGTGQAQTIQSDAQGRFRVPDLGIGDYEVQASKAGFATVIHKGITLTVGSENVVDFALAVGQTQQTVTVEGQVTQVETTNATVGALVDQAQMRELPLNGRDFESLIQLAPGVQNYYAGTASINGSTGANMREGRDPAVSVAGGRPEGMALLMDDQSLETFYNRGIGSITGTSLGVDGIAEFQTLTNTYGAQYGGAGAVMNAVSKSGTNSFHGSAYEFLRNNDMDARNFTDPSQIPELRKNQFGGTIGGPIRKDKVFFFFNYEGVQLIQGGSQIVTVPLVRTTTTATNPQSAAEVDAVLALYPAAQYNLNPAANTGFGTGQATVVKNQTAHENYYLGRIDYNLSDKDSFFGRYFVDLQNAVYPFSGGNTGIDPENDIGTNQFANLEERHIFSPTVVNIVRGSFSRTNVSATVLATHAALQFYPGAGRPDGNAGPGGGVTTQGTSGSSPLPENQLQNRFSEGDDIVWTRGAHTMRFGGSIDRVQSHVFWPFDDQAEWTFTSAANFYAGLSSGLTSVTNTPDNIPIRDYREIDFILYAQDDWKVSSKLSLNLGVRYEPMTNPVELHNNLFAIPNIMTDTNWTSVPHVMITNPSWSNFDPRFGFAYDPFKDHKTSIRGGFGIFHEVLSAGVWGIGFINSKPWNILTESCPPTTSCIAFTNPSIDGGAVPLSQTGGTVSPPAPSTSIGYAYGLSHTPYNIQYNLNIQREIVQGTVFSVGYVGSHGVNLISGDQLNAAPYFIDSSGVYHFVPNTTGSFRTNPALGGFSLGINGTNSRYNSLQLALNRRLTHSLQGQVSYTWSHCEGTGDATLGSLDANSPTIQGNPYYRQSDFSICGYNIQQALRVNGLYMLPFHGNRLADGWQLTGILAASTGLPFNVSDGSDQSDSFGGTARPNYTPNAPATPDPRRHQLPGMQ